MGYEDLREPATCARREAVTAQASSEGSEVTEHGVGPGSVVAGRFRLEDLLEEADGARFWRAVDLTLARNVAVHVLPTEDPRAPAALSAARTSALVSDSHILRVLDAVEQEDVVFLVHEWGSGVSLDEMLTDEVLDSQRAAWLVREVARGIVAGHSMGVAHGRLIPENVMISGAGSVKLIGFVVNGVLHGRPSTLPDGSDPPSEHESDVINLGALLYACLVGRWPGFPDSVLPAAPLEHGRPLCPRQVKAGVPKYLDTLCEDILATRSRTGRDSGRTRYESAAAIVDALSRYLGDGGDALPVVNAFTELGGPTAFVDPTRAPSPSTPGTLGSFDGDPDTGEDPREADTDPEATRAVLSVDDSAPGRALLRSDLSDSSAEARAQVDTEERSFGRETAVVPVTPHAGDDETLERSRAAREALGRRTDSDSDSDSEDNEEPEPPVTSVPPPSSSGHHDNAGVPGGGAHPVGGHPAHRPWGPATYASRTPAPAKDRRHNPGALALRLAGLVALLVLVVVGVLTAFNLGSTPDGQDTPPEDDVAGPERTPTPVEVARVIDLDPPSRGGNGEERSADTPLAHDGDPDTAWRTETYFDGPALAPYKEGVGLVVDLGDEHAVREVLVRLEGQGYDVTLFATEPGVGRPPDDIAGLERLGREQATVDDVAFETEVTTRYLVLWFRSLAQTDGGYAGEVSDIVVRS
jgi:serine/threonine protein kinase